jgi:hypothetical protein
MTTTPGPDGMHGRCGACPVDPGMPCRAADVHNAAICGYVAMGRPKWIAWVKGEAIPEDACSIRRG